MLSNSSTSGIGLDWFEGALVRPDNVLSDVAHAINSSSVARVSHECIVQQRHLLSATCAIQSIMQMQCVYTAVLPLDRLHCHAHTLSSTLHQCGCMLLVSCLAFHPCMRMPCSFTQCVVMCEVPTLQGYSPIWLRNLATNEQPTFVTPLSCLEPSSGIRVLGSSRTGAPAPAPSLSTAASRGTLTTVVEGNTTTTVSCPATAARNVPTICPFVKACGETSSVTLTNGTVGNRQLSKSCSLPEIGVQYFFNAATKSSYRWLPVTVVRQAWMNMLVAICLCTCFWLHQSHIPACSQHIAKS